MPTYRRRSARVLLVDGAGRVLLLSALLDPRDPARGHVWLTPGGGVHDGEALAAAAARELSEEVGVQVPASSLGGPVAYVSGYADLGWAKGVFRDDFFYYRSPLAALDVDVSGMEDRERATHAGHRWWSLPSLFATTERVLPLKLAPLLAELLAGGVPAAPVELPWHH
ncbi:NUDIX domain-containing protein [Actinoplanes sp. TBRC 11911]|uniref:NUDIX domain-containing protein n=1 Tax=Actinoplanes sp. TBRC 11911 TaxID=2729386 RepID=UPI00145D984C|nr:NUDIX domain-containing protein [Actinoplanes sp. TBRC 11911]NMO56225.1 NUDIX domain-containing protein [Actinoplanes sp. TBRC 11911]